MLKPSSVSSIKLAKSANKTCPLILPTIGQVLEANMDAAKLGFELNRIDRFRRAEFPETLSGQFFAICPHVWRNNTSITYRPITVQHERKFKHKSVGWRFTMASKEAMVDREHAYVWRLEEGFECLYFTIVNLITKTSVSLCSKK